MQGDREGRVEPLTSHDRSGQESSLLTMFLPHGLAKGKFLTSSVKSLECCPFTQKKCQECCDLPPA